MSLSKLNLCDVESCTRATPLSLMSLLSKSTSAAAQENEFLSAFVAALGNKLLYKLAPSVPLINIEAVALLLEEVYAFSKRSSSYTLVFSSLNTFSKRIFDVLAMRAPLYMR